MNRDELLKLYDSDLEQLIAKAEKITKENFNNEVEICSIISARTGKCSENCKYCSQSSYNHADIICHPLLPVEEVLRTICIFRIAMPKAILRYAGGRNTRLSKETQKLGLRAGINGLVAGDYLTTKGVEVKKDKEMLKESALEIATD